MWCRASPSTVVTAAMTRLSRRTFIAASAAMTATPALAQPGSRQKGGPGERLDAVIVGAGAAGIAAARRLIAAGRRVAIVEAAAEVGGRCVTDTKIFGVPDDRGAHGIHTPGINPVAELETHTALDI